jgi:hypothetical protein
MRIPKIGLFGPYGDAAANRDGSARCAELAERPARGGSRLESTVSVPRRLDRRTVEAYGELGVDRLVVVPREDLDQAGLEAFIRRNAPERIGAAPADG